ncbi:MAG: DEAD/DEAH box helicase [Methylococcaceae bacterium]
MSLELLSPLIRHYIHKQRWQKLRPIQVAAIERIINTKQHYILASPTASGKTEAAFLPILSQVNFQETGVQVLYISPLIALINDQFFRIEALCQHLDITITKWHGEAKLSAKQKLLKNPNGIVFITPESLESLFINKPFEIKSLFAQLKFVVIDELHAFIGTNRGIQLKSLLARLQSLNHDSFRIIGLSATIGDYHEAKQFTGNSDNTKVLLDKTKKQCQVEFKYFDNQGTELPLELLKDLYSNTYHDKVLIFPNSRGRVEEIAVKLKKIATKINGHSHYFAHHSSVDKSIREEVEYFAKNNKQENFTIVCTSTLELGIDIGTVNKVVQIDTSHSVASLIQRIGRSGRKENENGHLLLYATSEYSLLQALACWLLYLENTIDTPQGINKPYDILVHQLLAITKQYSGLPITDLIALIQANFAFLWLEKSDCETIISHLIEIELLEKIHNEVIIGLAGEKLVNTWDFYGVFKKEDNFRVLSNGNKIGEVPFSLQLAENENIFLAAKIWKMVFIDFNAKKIEVVLAKDGKKPLFFGEGALIDARIREKMLAILISNECFAFLDENSQAKLTEMRDYFASFVLQNYQCDRPLAVINQQRLLFFSFTSTRINRSIGLLFEIAGISYYLRSDMVFEIECGLDNFLKQWHALTQPIACIDSDLERLLINKPDIINFSKFGQYLPLDFQVSLLKEHYFDFDGAADFLKVCRLVSNE